MKRENRMSVRDYVTGRFTLNCLEVSEGRVSPAIFLMKRLVQDLPAGLSFSEAELQEYVIDYLDYPGAPNVGLNFTPNVSQFPLVTASIRPFVGLMKTTDKGDSIDWDGWDCLRVPVPEEWAHLVSLPVKWKGMKRAPSLSKLPGPDSLTPEVSPYVGGASKGLVG